ncbi:CYTH-like domain-containing protein [Dunaliella salina]|uniref:CYTH-like domain-containing protein n=1 Tax=Dunaliella salina TaxID=3046 RepID=A0ABQ7H3C2_DUNSA|nr:CYTH-like domain-containing protein [Dunaliella salina]|eukprot:KAF5841326.1 CYTH-like domain-containing protein [Dunaliella salina]
MESAYTLKCAGRKTVCCSTNRDQEVRPMEVEIKLRLPDRDAYEKVASQLASSKTASYAQENYFFDGDANQLEATHTVLRLRFYNGNDKATVTIKGKQVLEKGIGRASEVEEEVPDAAAARQWLQEPSKMLEAVPLVHQLKEKLGIQHLVGMGGFGNQRDVFQWEGETLELDQTSYEWGTMYEIEVETVNPEVLKPKLETFLTSNAIQHSYSKSSKFGNFKNRSLL